MSISITVMTFQVLLVVCVVSMTIPNELRRRHKSGTTSHCNRTKATLDTNADNSLNKVWDTTTEIPSPYAQTIVHLIGSEQAKLYVLRSPKLNP